MLTVIYHSNSLILIKTSRRLFSFQNLKVTHSECWNDYCVFKSWWLKVEMCVVKINAKNRLTISYPLNLFLDIEYLLIFTWMKSGKTKVLQNSCECYIKKFFKNLISVFRQPAKAVYDKRCFLQLHNEVFDFRTSHLKQNVKEWKILPLFLRFSFTSLIQYRNNIKLTVFETRFSSRQCS